MSPASPIVSAPETYVPEPSVYTEHVEPPIRQTQRKRVQTGIKCPHCKSPKIRFSASFTVLDGFLSIVGMRALRCHSCYHKFHRLFA